MDEEVKKQIAVFRFGVIADLVTARKYSRGELARLLREKSERSWQIPGSDRTRIAQDTIRYWIRLYRRGGGKLEALYPRDREDEGKSRSLGEESALALLKLREELPEAPVPQLIVELRRRKIVGPQQPLSPSTIYRFLHRNGLMYPKDPPAVDRRKFEAEGPNDLWQADALHGPSVLIDGRRRKTYLIAFIDDHSRLIPHGQFYLSEGVEAYLDCLRQAILKRGLPRRLYVDNGAALRSKHLEAVCASLGIALLHSRAYEPAGRGKIERYFLTVRICFLTSCPMDDLPALNRAYGSWLEEGYHNRVHSSTGETPLSRFAKGLECIRPAPRDLEEHFRNTARRRVERDRTVVFQNRLYDAPLSLIGKRVTLLYHEQDLNRIEVQYEGKSFGYLIPTDLSVNSRIRRERPLREQKEPDPGPAPKPPVSTGKLPLSPAKEVRDE